MAESHVAFSGGPGDESALLRLAARAGRALGPAHLAALAALSGASDIDPGQFPPALDGVRRSAPLSSLSALYAADALVSLAEGLPDQFRAHRRAAWLCLARVHGMRREGAAAATALARAEACSGPQEGETSADLLLVRGQGKLATGRYQEAHADLACALDAYGRLGDVTGRAEAALEISQCLVELGRYQDAQVAAETAAGLVQSGSWHACRTRIQSLDVTFYLTRYGEIAAEYEALAANCLAAGWQMDFAHVRVMQGLLATQQGYLDSAREHMEAALAVYQAEQAGYYLAVCRRGLAMLYRQDGRYADAQEHAQAALEAFQELGHNVAVGRCYHALGIIRQEWNRYDDALAAYDQALVCYESAGMRMEPVVIRVNQAEIQALRGYSHAALKCYEDALQMSLALHADFVTAHCLSNMAALNGRLGCYEEALGLYARARRRFTRAQVPLEAQICALRQAGLLDVAGRQAQARRLLAQARRYFHAGGHGLPLAFCNLALGEVAAGGHRQKKALQHYEAALDYFETQDHRLDAAACRLRMGEAYLASGEASRARLLLESAATCFGADLPDQAACAEHALGRAYGALGLPAQAARHHTLAVSHLTRMRRGIMTESGSGTFFASRGKMYRDAVHACLAAGDAEGTLAMVEAAKGHVLAGLLQRRDVVQAALAGQAGGVRELWQELWQTGRELEALRARWPSGASGVKGDVRGALAIGEALARTPAETARLARLSARQAELFDRIRRSVANFDILDAQADFSLEQLRAAACASFGSAWGALSYFQTAHDQLLILWVTAHGVRAWQRELTPILAAKLARATDPDPQQRELVYAGTLRGIPQPNPPGPRLLRSLGELLIPPEVQEGLAADQPLLISPHGQLHYLPFHALTLAGGRPLIEHALVSYAPTLRVWQTLLEALQVSGPNDGPSGQPSAHGVSSRSRQALVLGIRDFGGRAPQLMEAENEAHAVAAQFRAGGGTAVEMIGSAACLDALQTMSDAGELLPFDTIHLATHTVHDGSDPLQSCVLLADRALSVPDLFRLRLNARLVTLSACQTALSAVHPGDELIGLREALLFAGAHSLLVSLWHVDDAVTRTIMSGFYSHLLAGKKPASSLAEAQRTLWRQGVKPLDWAAFIYVG